VNTNTSEILQSVDDWIDKQPWPKTPNQVHDTLYGVDISCSTDISVHWKDYNWFEVFDHFKNHDKCFATLATKYVNTKLLNYDPQGKIRVRMSLTTRKMQRLMEKGTSPINNRIKFLNKLHDAGYSTHINLSPVILYKEWMDDYLILFDAINMMTSDSFKEQAGCEIIFLTHNKDLHERNLQRGLNRQEQFLWIPKHQEEKVSQYGGCNVRYKSKQKYVDQFTNLVKQEMPWLDIRYAF
jgi:DNA repair photolyase